MDFYANNNNYAYEDDQPSKKKPVSSKLSDLTDEYINDD